MDNYEFCADVVERLLTVREGSRILDYGCGRGTTVGLLRARGFDAFGCDVYYGGESWRSDVPEHMLSERIVRDMPDGLVPFPDDTFDIVLSNQVFEHVPDLGAVLDEIRRVLRPGGLLLFLFPDRSIWREGHYGLPFLHWFGKGSSLRTWYAASLRAVGFGYHGNSKRPLQWSRDACRWLDEWTYYRPYEVIRATLDARFVEVRHHERFWLIRRFGQRHPAIGRVPEWLQGLIVRKWAGMIGTCRKTGADAVVRSDALPE